MLRLMARLSFNDKTILEHVFDMGGGYVLKFSNAKFAEFVEDAIGIDPYCGLFDSYGGSKANLLRMIWKLESDHKVGTLIKNLLICEKRDPDLARRPPVTDRDRAECGLIAECLLQSSKVESLPSFHSKKHTRHL